MEKISFYGRKKRIEDVARTIKYAKREKFEKENNLPSKYQPRILGPSRTWKIFYSQKEAFEARSGKTDLHVFSFESECFQERSGQRMFLVTSYDEFWHYYSQLKNSQRRHYEVIAEGCVCRLYFDLEFLKQYNQESNGAHMTDIFISYVCGMLKRYWRLECTHSDVLQLEASTDAKFSIHLIFHLSNTAFKDNIVMGYFVKHIMGALLYIVNSTDLEKGDTRDVNKVEVSEGTSNDDQLKMDEGSSQSKTNMTLELEDLNVDCSQEDLFSTTDSSVTSVDENIQTKDLSVSMINRDISEEEDNKSGLNQSVLDACVNENEDFSENFIAGLNLTKEDLKSLVVKDKDGKDMLFSDMGVYTKNRNFRLYLASKLKKNNPLLISDANTYEPKLGIPRKKRNSLLARIPPKKEEQIFLDSLITNVVYQENMKVLTFENNTTVRNLLNNKIQFKNQETGEMVEGCDSSAYPAVDTFVKSIINKGGVKGDIRRWLYFSESDTLIFDIIKNRWCGRIQRQHKSNNIMIVVQLQRGIYYQKCHDPECKLLKYKSPDYNIPEEVIQKCNSNTKSSDIFEDATLSDEQLLSIVANSDDLVITAENWQEPNTKGKADENLYMHSIKSSSKDLTNKPLCECEGFVCICNPKKTINVVQHNPLLFFQNILHDEDECKNPRNSDSSQNYASDTHCRNILKNRTTMEDSQQSSNISALTVDIDINKVNDSTSDNFVSTIENADTDSPMKLNVSGKIDRFKHTIYSSTPVQNVSRKILKNSSKINFKTGVMDEVSMKSCAVRTFAIPKDVLYDSDDKKDKTDFQNFERDETSFGNDSDNLSDDQLLNMVEICESL